MVRAGARARVARWTAGGEVLLFLVVMSLCLALVIELQVSVRPPVVPLAGAACLAGWALAVRRLRRGWWLVLAAVTGAALTLWLAGNVLVPDVPWFARLQAMRTALLADPSRILDHTAPGGATTGPLAIVTLCWSMPLVAARAIRIGRPAIHAWAPLGVLLLGGLALRRADDIGPLVAFAASATLLTLATTGADRRRRWQHKGITESAGVSGAIARRGWLATGATVLLAWALSSVAVGAPLETAWRQVGEWWTDRPIGIAPGQASFGREFEIGGAFNPRRDVVALVRGISAPIYLRAVTHDTYTGRGWTQSRSTARPIAAGEPLLTDTSLELPDAGAIAAPIDVEVILERGGSTLLLPGQTLTLSIASEAIQGDGVLVGTTAQPALSSGDGYVARAIVRHASGADLAGSAAADPELFASYLALDNVSRRTQAEAARVTAGQPTAYGRAVALVDYLRASPFRYANRAERPAGGSAQDIVDFFLFDEAGRVGFCEQFATSMVVMARSVGIPARLARGYAGGDPAGRGTYRVRQGNSHAWAELYFPGYGWQVFEATPALPRVIRLGNVVAPPTGPTGSGLPTHSPAATVRPPSQADVPTGSGGGWQDARLPLALVAAASTAAVLGALTARRRGRPPNVVRSPAWMWARLTRRAARAGLTPRPSETAYEFAGAIAGVVPELGRDVRALASAYVVDTYGRSRVPRTPAGEIAVAWRRVMAALRRRRIANLVRRGGRR